MSNFCFLNASTPLNTLNTLNLLNLLTSSNTSLRNSSLAAKPRPLFWEPGLFALGAYLNFKESPCQNH